VEGFDFAPRTRLVYGAGSLARVGELAREFAARRVFFVSAPGLVAAGHAPRACALLAAAGFEVTLYAEGPEDPDARDVERCAAAARSTAPELFVGLGGGSAIDLAKGAAMLLANGGRMQDYWGLDKTRAPLAPLIAVPTTAGTGSEVQSYALIADEVTHQKMACGARDAAPRVALLDPELTLSAPRFVTACAGLDALGHALETAVTKKRTALSALFSREAARRIVPALPRVLETPADLRARGDLLLGATWAGLAIEHSMLGAAHALANPLSVSLGLAHGLAVGLTLAAVVRFNARDPRAHARYAELGAAAGLDGAAPDELWRAFLERVFGLAGLSPRLSEHGMRAEHLDELAEGAHRQWTAQFNPRTVGPGEFRALLQASL
jgi:alcohol dehydrogenase